MFLENPEILKDQVIIIDPYIHKKANLSKSQFLEKVKHIKQLRTSINSNYISFYITSLEENNNIIKFHEIVNKGVFEFENHYVFAIAIQPKLYNWFANTDLKTIQKQIVSWLAGLYFFNPNMRHVQEREIYPPLFEEILKIVDKYYHDFNLPHFELLHKKFKNNYDETIFEEEERCEEKYLQVFKEFCKTEPPEFLISPFEYRRIKEWGVNDYHNFEFVQAYLNDKDWEEIIKGESQDDMKRVESLEDLWIKWKHVYTTFDKRKNFVYSFYIESTDKIENKKHKSIPKNVKNEVWQRDQGKCVECGSKENLEFDHIIPDSKGGSSTYRNLQLLCESCNRKKRDNL